MAKRLKVSVVMATYNGEKYIKEQLDSIVSQTRNPDEILIFDDASTDKTKDIIFSYEKQYDNIKVIINSKNKGWKANFAKAITLAEGDLIFLADQDDIWFQNKIQKMAGVVEKNNSIELLASNYKPIYETEKAARINKFFYKKYGIGLISKIDKPKLYCVGFRPGCCYCFQRKLVPYFEKIWSDDFPHDLILWEIAAFRGSLYIINDELIFFRRHLANNTPRNPHDKAGRIEMASVLLKIVHKIDDLGEACINSSNKKILCEQKMYFTSRINMMNHKSVHNILSALKYIHYYPMCRGFVGDLVAK